VQLLVIKRRLSQSFPKWAKADNLSLENYLLKISQALRIKLFEYFKWIKAAASISTAVTA